MHYNESVNITEACLNWTWFSYFLKVNTWKQKMQYIHKVNLFYDSMPILSLAMFNHKWLKCKIRHMLNIFVSY